MKQLRLAAPIALALFAGACTRTIYVTGGQPAPDSRPAPAPAPPRAQPAPAPNASTAALLGIPPGHLPREGECRVWIPGVPPGQQRHSWSRPCQGIRFEAPPGSWIVYRPSRDRRVVHVRVINARQAGVVTVVRIFDSASGRLLREEPYDRRYDDDEDDDRNGRDDRRGRDNGRGRDDERRDDDRRDDRRAPDDRTAPAPKVDSTAPKPDTTGRRGVFRPRTQPPPAPQQPAPQQPAPQQPPPQPAPAPQPPPPNMDPQPYTPPILLPAPPKPQPAPGTPAPAPGTPAPAPAPAPAPHYATLDVPPGHLPDAGQCRIWIPGTVPGRQPQKASGDCAPMMRTAPAGSWVLYRPTSDRSLIHVRVVDCCRPGVIVTVRVYDGNGRFLREEKP